LGRILVQEGCQLGIGRRACSPGHGLGYREPATVTRLQRLPGQKRTVDPGHSAAGEYGSSIMGLHILVADIPLQPLGRHVLCSERLFVLLLAELPGHLIEEGRDFPDLFHDQCLAGTNPRLPGPGHETLTLGLFFKETDVDVLGNHVLDGHGTASLLLDTLAHVLEIRTELGARDAAFASADHVLASEAREHVHLGTGHEQAEAQKDQQTDRPLGFCEISEDGNHRAANLRADGEKRHGRV
jgi:hypothetical protein